MTVRTTDGTCLSLSTVAPANFDATGYAALTWTGLGQVNTAGSPSKVYNDVTSYDLCTGEISHAKGSSDWQPTTVTVDNEESDAGQVILADHYDGAKKRSPVYVKVQHPARDGETTGRVQYYASDVYSFAPEDLAQDAIWRSTVEMRVKTNTYVNVPAVPTP